VNRLTKSLRAALELARRGDKKRIRNSDSWTSGLGTLPDSARSRNVILSDAEVLPLVAAAYMRDPALGLLIDVLAVTGCKAQTDRALVENLIDPCRARGEARAPKLFMPKSGPVVFI
jgi:hypothetical protein